MRRLQPHWPPLTAQVGAVPGGQPIEALFAAHYTMSIASVSGTEPLYVKLDIRGAFDNLKHSSVAAYLANLPPAIAFEASRLLHLLLHQNFMFSFLQEDWEHHTSNGTPQGGSHSAGLFARTLDYAIGQLGTRHLALLRGFCCMSTTSCYASRAGVKPHVSYHPC
eukprot:Skav225849  [mRNA]  locus=scaffold345:190749:191243:+ [translate_table: standard]